VHPGSLLLLRADSARRAHLEKRLLVSDANSHVRFIPLLDELQHAPLRRRRLPGRALGSDTSAVGAVGAASGAASETGARWYLARPAGRRRAAGCGTSTLRRRPGAILSACTRCPVVRPPALSVTLHASWNKLRVPFVFRVCARRFCVYYTLRTETRAGGQGKAQCGRRWWGRERSAQLSWPSCIGGCQRDLVVRAAALPHPELARVSGYQQEPFQPSTVRAPDATCRRSNATTAWRTPRIQTRHTCQIDRSPPARAARQAAIWSRRRH
jgi:hypothetical protein